MPAVENPNTPLARRRRTAAENLRAPYEHVVATKSMKAMTVASYVAEALAELTKPGVRSAISRQHTPMYGIEHNQRVQDALDRLPTTNLEIVHYEPTVHLLNCVSAAYYTHVYGRSKRFPAIIFGSRAAAPPGGDYLAIQIRPDYYAYVGTFDELMSICNEKARPSPRPWSEMIEVGEHKRPIHAKPADGQLKSYLAALKRYRADLPTVYAFSVEKGKIKLASLNPCGMVMSKAVPWVELNSWVAHVALVYRAHHTRDLSIQNCSAQREFYRWDVRTDNGDGFAVSPFYASVPPGRTTFACFEVLPLPEGDDRTDPDSLRAMNEEFFEGNVQGFWKMSWQTVSSRPTELDLLSEVHKNGWVPGLVRPYNMRPPVPTENKSEIESQPSESSALPEDLPSQVTSPPSLPSPPKVIIHHPGKRASVGRFKDVLHLGSIGEPLSQCKTPRQLVEAMYDLIEVHAHLGELGVLHRDVSWYNVMCNPEHFITTHPYLHTDEELPRPCISSILGRPNPKPSILLADLDHSVRISEDKLPAGEKTGTPMFISVEVETPEEIDFKNQPLDRIRARLVAAEQYADAFDKALLNGKDGKFMAAFDRVMELEAVRIANATGDDRAAPSPPPQRHDLRHDAESIYWVFLWAFARARPADAPPKSDRAGRFHQFCRAMFEHCIGSEDGDSGRAGWLAQPSNKRVFHPWLQPFEELFDILARYLAMPWHLYCTVEKPGEKPIMPPDHVHIAFRRFLLAWLLNPANAEALDIALDTDEPRYTSALESLSRLAPPTDSKRMTTGATGAGTASVRRKANASASAPTTTAAGSGSHASTKSLGKRKPGGAPLPARKRTSSALATRAEQALDDENDAPDDTAPDEPVVEDPESKEDVAEPEADPAEDEACEAQSPVDEDCKSSAHYRRLLFWRDRTLWFGAGVKPLPESDTDEDEEAEAE